MSTRINKCIFNPHHQSGAALIVSMVLLMVLTLLAISTMRTASLEIAMAGNNQYTENAFQLAETGVERHIADALANPNKCDTPNDVGADGCDLDDIDIYDMKGSFTTRGSYMGETDCKQKLVSMGLFQSFNYEVQAVGTTDNDGATAQHTLGWNLCR
jgi:type IV pilus assembly protein PilX